MELFHVFTSNGRIFYTSISLNDRFKQYQVFCPVRYRYRGYFTNRVPKRPRYDIYQSWNRFESAPIFWDSNCYEQARVWTFFGESPWGGSDQQEPKIYKPVASTKKKRKWRRKKSKNTKRKTPHPITKEQLDNELDQYMINVK